MNVAIIDYSAGNTRSVQFGLERIGVTGVRVTDDPETICSADRVIFPGVGEAASAMRCLRRAGLDRLIRDLSQPVLGICLGMQLLCSRSEERDTACLGVFDDTAVKFCGPLKVPHTGWNQVPLSASPLFRGIPADSWFYFVHSYYIPAGAHTDALCSYGIEFSSTISKRNFFGCQFHPEKSGPAGELFLANFIQGDL